MVHRQRCIAKWGGISLLTMKIFQHLGVAQVHCVVISMARGVGIIWHGLGRWSPSLTLWIVSQCLVKGTMVNSITTPKVVKYSHFFFQKEAL